MVKKICSKCGAEKSTSCFYKHKKMADGHLNKCKDCARSDALKARYANLEYYQEYDRKRANLPHRIKLRKKVSERWKKDPELRKRSNTRLKALAQNNKLRRAANVITGNAIRDKKLIKLPCEVCGKKKVEAHHDDYNYPLSVRWLCRKHHMEHHKKERDKQRGS